MRTTGSRLSRGTGARLTLGRQWAPRVCGDAAPVAPPRSTGVSTATLMAGLTAVARTESVPLEAGEVRAFAESALTARGGTGIDTCVRMDSATPDGATRGLVVVGGAHAVVAVEREPAEAERDGSDGDDLVHELRSGVLAATVPTAVLPLLWLRWAGVLHPAEGASAYVRDVSAIDRRVRSAAEPVPAEAPGLAPMWAGAWREWSIRDEAAGTWLRYIGVPGHGQYVERPVPGEACVEFAPRPSGLVWGDLVAAYCHLAPVRAAAGNDVHW